MHVHCATVNATQLSAVAKAGKVKAVHFEEPRLGCFSSLQQAVSQELGLFTYTHIQPGTSRISNVPQVRRSMNPPPGHPSAHLELSSMRRNIRAGCILESSAWGGKAHPDPDDPRPHEAFPWMKCCILWPYAHPCTSLRRLRMPLMSYLRKYTSYGPTR